MHQLTLLRTRRFLPLFLTQFCGAFNDNVFKNALVILITYMATGSNHQQAQILVTASAGVFILPFFLFSATAGQLADKYEKSYIIRLIKMIEIALMLIASVGFYFHHTWMLMVVLFAMGMHSTFFGPLKYSILPDHLAKEELISGNGLVEAGTFIAILLGTLVGGLLILREHGTVYVSSVLLCVALLGFIASRFIPLAVCDNPHLKISANLFQQTWKILQNAREVREVFLSILGISWFWLVGATFLSQFPSFAKNVIGGDETVVTFFLALFSVGIGMGSLLCNHLLKGRISAAFVPICALGMAVFTAALYVFSKDITPTSAPINIETFLSTLSYLPVVISLLCVSICGGVYIVPLYAIMQSCAPIATRSRVIAANNVLNALFMVISALATIGMLALHYTVPDVFLAVAMINLPVALLAMRMIKNKGMT